jgi:hypothetical protein
MSVIESSALQKLGQCYRADKTQKSPGKGDIEIKILPGYQTEDGTKTNYNYTQYVNRYGPVGGTGAATYPVQTQKTAYKQADVK